MTPMEAAQAIAARPRSATVKPTLEDCRQMVIAEMGIGPILSLLMWWAIRRAALWLFERLTSSSQPTGSPLTFAALQDLEAVVRDRESTVEKPFFCGRCGVEKTATKGQSCESCQTRYRQEQAIWKDLKCATCGKAATGFNVNGAFCHEHYSKPVESTVSLPVRPSEPSGCSHHPAPDGFHSKDRPANRSCRLCGREYHWCEEVCVVITVEDQSRKDGFCSMGCDPRVKMYEMP